MDAAVALLSRRPACRGRWMTKIGLKASIGAGALNPSPRNGSAERYA